MSVIPPPLFDRVCSLSSFRYRCLYFEPIPGGIRDLIPLQPVETRITLPPHVGWEHPCGM